MLSAALDKCYVSERDAAVHLSVSFLEAVSIDPSENIINWTSIRNVRAPFRESYNKQVRKSFKNFNVESIVIHWDTKQLENVSGKLVDRLAIIGAGSNREQLLEIPELCAGTGIEISFVVYDTIEYRRFGH